MTITYDDVGNRFIVTSSTAGVHSDTVMKYAFDDGQDGQYIGAMLKLENGQALS